jgi:hypothetical protein
MSTGSQGQGSPTEPDEQGSSKEPPTILELQKMALQRALSTLDLDAAQSCTSCNSNSCNRLQQ